MKKHLCILFGSAALLLAVACSKVENTPEAVVEAFFTAVFKKDFDEGAKYCAPQSMEMYNLGRAGLAMMPAGGSISNIQCTTSEDGMTATCKASIVMAGEGEQTQDDINMVKVDGEWKVVLDKNK